MLSRHQTTVFTLLLCLTAVGCGPEAPYYTSKEDADTLTISIQPKDAPKQV